MLRGDVMKVYNNAEMLANLTFNLLARCQEKETYLAEKHDLFEAELKCLRLMSSEESLNNSELADKMNLSPSRITRIIDGLIKKGYVLREINKNDRRNMIICLSKRGKNLTNKLNKAFLEIHKEILEDIDYSEHEALLIAMGNLYKAVEKWLKKPR